MTCEVYKDQHGTSYHVPEAAVVKTPSGRILGGLPGIDVWWSREFKLRAEETVIVRQEYADRPDADVIELTLGQAYDLIAALTKAVDHT